MANQHQSNQDLKNTIKFENWKGDARCVPYFDGEVYFVHGIQVWYKQEAVPRERGSDCLLTKGTGSFQEQK